MTVSAYTAAKYLCEKSEWELSNLSLQKMLYLAHMVHLGRHQEPLVSGIFEAWEYGPVLPDVYHRAKVFGKKPVQNVFHDAADDIPDARAKETLDEALNAMKDRPPSDLVAITHWEKGAWAQNYSGNTHDIIPNKDIVKEYYSRTSPA